MRTGVVLALLLASCTPTGLPSPNLSAAERQGCLAAGGKVAVDGLLQGELCVMPAPDAGKSCRKATDCSVRCDADTRTCAADANPFGCYSYLDEKGQIWGICVD